MSSGGPESKAVSQAPDQDGEGESAEQLTKFVRFLLTIRKLLVGTKIVLGLGLILIWTNSMFHYVFYTYTCTIVGRRTARQHGKSEVWVGGTCSFLSPPPHPHTCSIKLYLVHNCIAQT